jgi:uncharacterized membrane protein YfcA
MMSETASTATIILLSLCSFLGNIGAAVTAFGQAIIFLFVWQIVELAGYEGDFKYAVFIQALSLFSIQPLQLYQANVIKHAHRRILLLFVPITLISTPIGQLVSAYVPTKIVQAVAGVLVTFVALWELYCKRNWLCRFCKKEFKEQVNRGADTELKADVLQSGEVRQNTSEKDDNFEVNPSEEKQEREYPTNDLQSPTEEDDQRESDEEGEMPTVSIVEAKTSPDTANTESKPEEDLRIIGCNKATWVTLFAGFASGFLGGMVSMHQHNSSNTYFVLICCCFCSRLPSEDHPSYSTSCIHHILLRLQRTLNMLLGSSSPFAMYLCVKYFILWTHSPAQLSLHLRRRNGDYTCQLLYALLREAWLEGSFFSI